MPLQWFAEFLLILISPAGLMTAGVTVAGLLFPRLLGRPVRRVERVVSRTARRSPALLCATVALIVYVAAGVVRMPTPIIHDEFSNLLGGETFLHVRLTNPTHPHWRHFENFHILHQPSYASKFLPATAGALAVGMVLGHPAIGMWLVIAGVAAALAWALSGCLPRVWAATGALLIVSHPLVFMWGESYWGGAVALLGSALFLGGVVRLLSPRLEMRRAVDATCKPRSPNRHVAALAAASGLAILLCSRPYEGAALALATCIAVGVFYRTRLGGMIRFLVVSCIAVVVPAAVFLLYQNWRVTEHPLLLPYVLYERTYNPTPLFVWQQPSGDQIAGPPEMVRYYMNLVHRALRQRTFEGWIREARRKIRDIGDDLFTLPAAWVRWVPALMLIPLPVLLRRRHVAAASVTVLLTIAAILCVTWYAAYYLAVVLPLLALVWAVCLRTIRCSRIAGRRTGLLWSRAMVIAWAVAFALEWYDWRNVAPMWRDAIEREQIQRRLERLPGRDLVIVEYGAHHLVHVSWTYNGARIDDSEVVWARSLSPQENRQLMDYFDGRSVWIARPDEEPPLRLLRQARRQELSRGETERASRSSVTPPAR